MLACVRGVSPAQNAELDPGQTTFSSVGTLGVGGGELGRDITHCKIRSTSEKESAGTTRAVQQAAGGATRRRGIGEGGKRM
jgi:hypothetical protein